LKGLSWQGSYRSYKALFQRWHGNYRVTERPRTKQLKKNKQQWSAALTSVGASHSAPHQYYQISLTFFSLTGGKRCNVTRIIHTYAHIDVSVLQGVKIERVC
jgi:hypothetical protein